MESRRPESGTAGFDAERVCRDFPILMEQMYGNPLVYLDNAATSQKPQAVIDAMSRFFLKDDANVHRGGHSLSERSGPFSTVRASRSVRATTAPGPS